MKNLFLLFAVSLLFSCSNENSNQNDPTPVLNGNDYLIFGHYYGFCGGEKCIETYKLTATTLAEDSLDIYPSINNNATNYIQMSNDKFILSQVLFAFFPTNLLLDTNMIFGVPDAYDQGGIHVQYSVNGVFKEYYFDNDLQNVPVQYHAFLNKIKEKIILLE